MSASRSTEGEGIDDQKREIHGFPKKGGAGLYISGTACMSLISGTESTNGVESHEMERLNKAMVPSQRAPDKQTHFCLRGEKSDAAILG